MKQKIYYGDDAHPKGWPNVPILFQALLHLLFPNLGGFLGLGGYVRLDESRRVATVMFCSQFDGTVASTGTYKRVGFIRSLLLYIAIPLRRLYRFGRFAIDAPDTRALNAWLFVHGSGQLYLRIPSRGWFISDIPFELSERNLQLRNPIHADPAASRHAAGHDIAPN